MRGKPGGHLCDLGVGCAEASTKLGRRKPLVIERRIGILLRGEKGVKVGLLHGRGVEREEHAVETRGGIGDALIELRSRERMHVAMEYDHARFVDGVCRDWQLRASERRIDAKVSAAACDEKRGGEK